MRILLSIIILLTLSSCATKKYSTQQFLPKGIKSATEEIYVVKNHEKKLLQKKDMVFTNNGRINTSITVDSLENLLQQTEKRLWFVKESYRDKEPYYCKTRWKSRQRERISCYSQKQYKQNESIYHYNKNGTIHKIVDNFTSFHTQYFYYTNNQIAKIIIKDKSDTFINKILMRCVEKDSKGTCTKQIKESSNPEYKQEIIFLPVYK